MSVTYWCVCSQFSYTRREDNVLVTTECGPTSIGRRSKFAPGHDAKLKALLVDAYFEGTLRVCDEPTTDLLLDHARAISDKFCLAVAKLIDVRSRKLRADLDRLALSQTGENRETRAVFRALQAPDGQRNSHEPIGASFGSDRVNYEKSAKAWLRDRSELSDRTLVRCDWDAVYDWFIHGK